MLTQTLRSIFVPYFSYLITHIVNTFQSDCQTVSDLSLQTKLLECLTFCFSYDNSNFLNPELFEKLLHPLINLLDQVTETDTFNDTSDLQYLPRIKKYYIPCIVQLAQNLNNEALWKPLNFQLLQKSRAENPLERYAVVSTLMALYGYIGEQYLTLLPESVQYISELLEDSNDKVIKSTSTLTKELEKLLGSEEALQNLLS